MKFNIKQNKFNFKTKYAVIKEYPKLENIEITPSKEEQTFKSENYYGYDEVKVNGITNEVDKNIVPENIKEGVSILGVTGNLEDLTEGLEIYNNELTKQETTISDIVEVLKGKADVPIGGGNLVSKGLVINEHDENGYPIDVSVVGITEMPSYYFYGLIGDYNGNEKLFSRVNANLHLPDDLISIGEYAFHSCNTLALTELPSGITEIKTYTFYGCANLALTELPSGITKIGTYAFYNNRKIALTELPSGITSIGAYAFNGCTNLALTELPSGCKGIVNYTFYGCTGLKELTCHGVITTISTRAFYNCSNLGKIVFPNVTSVPTLSNKDAFTGTPIASGTGYIYVPDDLVDTFKSKTNWSTYAAQIKGVSEL